MSLANTTRITLADPLDLGPPRFIVGGQAGSASGDVKMYEWHRARGAMQLVGLQTDVGHIRTIAWSPSQVHRHLLAIGLSTGKTSLLSLSPRTLSLSLDSDDTPILANLPIKYSRSTTAASFSPLDPNYLATGYERHRSDHSLLIWDISSLLDTLQPDLSSSSWRRPSERLAGPTSSSDNHSATKPIQHYCPSEHVNDVTFLPSSYSVLASTNNKAIRLFDLRAPSPQPGTPRETGSSGAGAVSQWMTRAVSNLSVDPSNHDRFASFEGSSSGSTVRLWDTRRPGVEVLSLDVPGSITGLHWISKAEGSSQLGVGTKDGVKLWDILQSRTTSLGQDGSQPVDRVHVGEMRQVINAKQPLQSFAFSTRSSGHAEALYVAKDGTINIGTISSATPIASGPRGDFAAGTEILDPDQAESSPNGVHDALADNEGSEDETETVTRLHKYQLQPSRVASILAESGQSRPSSPASGSSILRGVQKPSKGGRGTNEDLAQRQEGFDEDLDSAGMRKLLRSEIGCVMRQRAARGYGLRDLLLNAAVATKFPGYDRLAGVWEYVNHLRKVLGPDIAKQRNVDLTHSGIYAIWTGQDLIASTAQSPASSIKSQSTHLSEKPGRHHEPHKQTSAAWAALRNTQHQHPSRSHSTPIQSPSPGNSSPDRTKAKALPMEDLIQAVEGINHRLDDHHANVRFPPTSKLSQRSLILSICGDLSESEISRLVSEDQRTKAACWSYFSGEEESAVKILMSSPNSTHRLLGTTLAGFLNQSQSKRGSSSSFFDDHWRSLVNRMDDPYIRCMLSRIAGDDWESVLEEEAMPLLDRIAIAVCNLSDEEMNDFMSSRFSRFSRNPSPTLNFFSLFGFTSPSISCLQKWLDRSGDVQTVALLSCYFPESRLSAREAEMLHRVVESYRGMLDSWTMWEERVDFDVRRMELGRALGETRVTEETRGSGKGICPLCNNSLSKTHEEHLNPQSNAAKEKPLSERLSNCTFCGQSLPRCVICLKHVESRSNGYHQDWDDLMDGHLDTIDDAYVCCLTCRHGGHANHILPWFEGDLGGEHGNEFCPVSGCNCRCADI